MPARALQELARIAQAAEADELSVSVRANQIIFEVGGDVLSSRLIDGQFPNYRQLLPDAFEHELTLASAELTEVVRRISLMAQKNAPLRLRFSEGELTISAQTPDVGEASQTLPVPFAGEPFEIGFNPEFLRDGLESSEGGDLVLKLISPLRPGPDRVGGRQRLPVPDHADPPERLAGGRRARGDDRDPPEAARLPQLRTRGRRARRRADRRARIATAPARRTSSRRCTSAAPGARAARPTSARSCASTARSTRVEVDLRDDEGREHALSVGFEPGEPKRLQADGVTVERSSTCSRGR